MAEQWKPNYPNLAFRSMDEADAYWGAKIVTAFDDELVRTLVAAGDYTRPEVTRFVEDSLRMRRDKIGRYWFDEVAPLEDFELDTSAGDWILSFRDLGVERGYAQASERRYVVAVKDPITLNLRDELESGASGEIHLTPVDSARVIPADRRGRTTTLVVEIRSTREDGAFSLPVRVFIGRLDQDPETRVLGWAHAPRD